MLKLRLLVGLPLAAAVIGLLVLDGFLSTVVPPNWPLPWLGINLGQWLCNGAICNALVAIFVWLAANEVYRFAWAQGIRPPCCFTQLAAVGMAVGPFVVFNSVEAAQRTGEGWGMFLLALVLGLTFWHQAARYGTSRVMANVSTTLFIILYTGGLGHFMSRLRMEVGGREGVALLLYSLFVVKMTDVGAYFIGRAFGRHPLIPWLSPKKTWEGLAGGCAVAALCALGVGHALCLAGIASIPWNGALYLAWLLLFGLMMALLSTAGDLCASLLKRDAAVKDSGAAFPGLGGVLDVLDSPLLAIPAAWLFWTRLL